MKGGLGGDYKDDSLDILPYFSASCYKGFGDDSSGFYAVYKEVFNRLAAEDSDYMKEDDLEIPGFGNSDSSYEEVVAPFYSYWMYYSTKKTFYWLDPHDTRQAPNHKIAKLIEKENKKVRDKAKKQRNEEVRNLVAFVRKRDKRVQAWNKLLENKAKENQKKSEENRIQKMQERRSQMKDYKESEWLKFANVENDLKQIEENLAKEFGDECSDSENEDSEEIISSNSFFCVACNKVFKTEKSFANHEKSKKHKENVHLLKETIVKENTILNLPSSDITTTAKESDDSNKFNTIEINEEKKKKKKLKQKMTVKSTTDSSESEDSNNDFDILQTQSKKSRNRNIGNNNTSDEEFEKKGKKKNKKQIKITDTTHRNLENSSDSVENKLSFLKISQSQPLDKSNCSKSTKKYRKTDSNNEKEINVDLVCAVCQNQFPSKNKLFNHLKATGHSVYLPNSATAQKQRESTKKRNKPNKLCNMDL